MRINIDLANLTNLYRMRIKAAVFRGSSYNFIRISVIVDQNGCHFSLFACIF